MKKKPLVGKRIKVVSGTDYLGMYGTIEYCSRCCRAYRIQFDGIANNVKLKQYRKNIIIFN